MQRTYRIVSTLLDTLGHSFEKKNIHLTNIQSLRISKTSHLKIQVNENQLWTSLCILFCGFSVGGSIDNDVSVKQGCAVKRCVISCIIFVHMSHVFDHMMHCRTIHTVSYRLCLLSHKVNIIISCYERIQFEFEISHHKTLTSSICCIHIFSYNTKFTKNQWDHDVLHLLRNYFLPKAIFYLFPVSNLYITDSVNRNKWD